MHYHHYEYLFYFRPYVLIFLNYKSYTTSSYIPINDAQSHLIADKENITTQNKLKFIITYNIII